MKYIVLAVVGVTIGFLIARIVFPLIVTWGAVAFLALPVLLVAMLLFARAFRRGTGS